MPVSVTLPALGESVTEGTVTRWLKQVGDTVATDEPLLEVSTDKVDTEIPSPAAGTLLEIKVAEDETVEVGAELATIGDADEQPAGDSASDTDSSDTDGNSGSGESETVPPAPDDEPRAADDESRENAGEQQEPSEQAPAPAAESSGSEASGGGSGTAVTLPALGESVTEGTVTRWLKQVGDDVAVDEPLLEVSTDKVDTEIPSPVAGTLLEIKVGEDETVEVGAELATIGDKAGGSGGGRPRTRAAGGGRGARGQAAPEQAQPEPEQAVRVRPDRSRPSPRRHRRHLPSRPRHRRRPRSSRPQPPAQGGEEGAGYVTPLVRKLAAQHGVDLSAITGTGVGGRIRKQDVLAAAEAATAAKAAPAEPAAAEPAKAPAAAAASASPSPLRGQTVKMPRIRQVIAKRMVESLHVSAQLTSVVEVDVTRIARLRNRVKDDFAGREGVKLSFLPFFVKASVEALKQHPSLNCRIDAEAMEVTYFDYENLSLAVDTERGLSVPVIKNAGDLTIAGLARRIADLAERTRTNKISPDDLSGGTFTITNTGSRGALFDTPIINQPQVAILGTGAVVKRPVVVDDDDLGETIAVRYMMYLSLSYDHRIVDGADAARFLVDVKKRLEEAAFEGELG